MKPTIVDLTMPCSNSTEGFSISRQQDPPTCLGHACHAWDLSIKSHSGTYFESSSHVFRDGRNTDAVPLNDLVLPGVCLRVAKPDRCIDAHDLDSVGAGLEPGSALLIDTMGATDKYFSRTAAAWMARRGVKLMGSNTLRYDSGFENPTGFFVELFGARIPIVANLVDLHRLPADGFRLVVLPLRISGVCTVPCRVVAILERPIVQPHPR